MSDLSEFVPEVELTHPKLLGLVCKDCIPVVELSKWPVDAVNMPRPAGRDWPGDFVMVLNVSHAVSCPAFRAVVAAGHALDGVLLADVDLPGFESLMLRETFAFDLNV